MEAPEHGEKNTESALLASTLSAQTPSVEFFRKVFEIDEVTPEAQPDETVSPAGKRPRGDFAEVSAEEVPERKRAARLLLPPSNARPARDAAAGGGAAEHDYVGSGDNGDDRPAEAQPASGNEAPFLGELDLAPVPAAGAQPPLSSPQSAADVDMPDAACPVAPVTSATAAVVTSSSENGGPSAAPEEPAGSAAAPEVLTASRASISVAGSAETSPPDAKDAAMVAVGCAVPPAQSPSGSTAAEAAADALPDAAAGRASARSSTPPPEAVPVSAQKQTLPPPTVTTAAVPAAADGAAASAAAASAAARPSGGASGDPEHSGRAPDTPIDLSLFGCPNGGTPEQILLVQTARSEYNDRVKSLMAQGKSKPDMIAYKVGAARNRSRKPQLQPQPQHALSAETAARDGAIY